MSVKEVGSILHNGTYYWLASAFYSNYLWNVDGSNGTVNYVINTTNGVRLVLNQKDKQASQLTENVESMNKDDIDKIVGEVTTGEYAISKFGSLLHNQTIYYLASANTGRAGSLWGIDAQFIYVSNYLNTSHGIRAKVTLVEGVRRTASLQ